MLDPTPRPRSTLAQPSPDPIGSINGWRADLIGGIGRDGKDPVVAEVRKTVAGRVEEVIVVVVIALVEEVHPSAIRAPDRQSVSPKRAYIERSD